MFKKVIVKFLGVVLATAFIFTCKNINMDLIFSLPSKSAISTSDLQELSTENSFGSLIDTSVNESTVTVGGESVKNTSLVLKLFGFIPIKKVDVIVCDDKSVYLGGIPLGFSITTKGVIVVGENSVLTKDGAKITEKSTELERGDILIKVNGIEIENATEISKQLEASAGKKISVTVIRKGKQINCDITPVLDSETETYKLGLWVRNDAQGVGTLTFVTNEDKFGALGHAITDFETGIEIPVDDGKVYNCTTLGITKGTKGKAGELRCLFVQSKNSKGSINKNTKYGVFGELNDKKQIVDENVTAKIGTRIAAKMGSAKIVSSVSGIREEYEIEIIKTYRQPKCSDKSFIFRVKDKRLLELTGGIVQGMSGSPIIQNGKLIGAVTHVFLYDPTKGYGVYADWMLEQVA